MYSQCKVSRICQLINYYQILLIDFIDSLILLDRSIDQSISKSLKSHLHGALGSTAGLSPG